MQHEGTEKGRMWSPLVILLQWQSSRVAGDQPEPGMECPSERGCLRCKNPLNGCGILSFGPTCEMSPRGPLYILSCSWAGNKLMG